MQIKERRSCAEKEGKEEKKKIISNSKQKKKDLGGGKKGLAQSLGLRPPLSETKKKRRL